MNDLQRINEFVKTEMPENRLIKQEYDKIDEGSTCT